ncbi:MAG TPA: histidine kinase [Pyrinomonadaceae bacterium]|nr:histidine kinase [Pyrinomonadaceae bacterium]
MNNVRRKLGYFAAFFALWTLVALIFVSLSAATELGRGNQPNLRLLFLIHFTRFYLWGLFSPLIYRFVRRFPIEIRAFRWRNLFIHLAGMTVFCTVHQLLLMIIRWMVNAPPGTSVSSFFENFFGNFFNGVYLGVVIYPLIVFAIQAFVFYQNYRAEEEQKLRVTAQLARAELHGLKMQIHPHFLFNTLHSISSLVLEDPPKANQMIARLGDFLRLTLEHSERQFVTLKEEIEFARCYLEIEQVRFSDRLQVEFNVESASLTAQVPHLILQPLVENAIQHAIAPRASGGSIKISAKKSGETIRVEIADSGEGIHTGRNVSNNGQGVGLANVRSRLEQLYGANHKFELIDNPAGGLTAVIEIPFVAEIKESPFAV